MASASNLHQMPAEKMHCVGVPVNPANIHAMFWYQKNPVMSI